MIDEQWAREKRKYANEQVKLGKINQKMVEQLILELDDGV